MKQKCFIFILILLFHNVAYCANDSTEVKKKQFMFTALNYHHGKVLPTNDFVKGANNSGNPIGKYQSLSIKIGWQNPGYTNWQKIYRGPYYGLGLFIGDFYNAHEIGYPLSVYGFYGIPVVRFNRFELYSEFQYGIAWNWQHYDSTSNPHNIAIGSGLTVHLDVGLTMNYSISDRLNVAFGYSFSHFSNGGFERPNRGFNLIAPSIQVKYYSRDKPDYKNIGRPPKDLKKYDDVNFMLEYGDHQMVEHELDTNYFSISGIGIFYSKQFGNVYRSGMGVDLNYLLSLSANPDGTMGDKSSWDNLTIGLLYAPEFMIDKVSILTGFGIYAKHSKYGNFNQTYQRAAVKYTFANNLSFGVGVRAINFMLAEFLEFSIGYRIKWERKW